jgi:lipopolysaccharide transport system permease protein
LNTAKNIEDWTQIIEPKSKWYQLNLKEVWDYRDLILIFVRRDIVASYKQTVLGPLWLFLGPLFTVVVYTFVFTGIAKISTDGIPAPLFYLGGTTLWNYFQMCFTGTSSTFIANAGIFGKVYFPRLVSPISAILSGMFKLVIQLVMFLCFYLYYYFLPESVVVPNTSLFLLPLFIVLLGGIALGMGILISALTTKYRDFTYFVSFGITLLMYATPVIYPASTIPIMYRPILKLNPISPIIESFRYSCTSLGSLDWNGLIYSFSFMVIVLFVGMVLFHKTEKTFMDTV